MKLLIYVLEYKSALPVYDKQTGTSLKFYQGSIAGHKKIFLLK